MRKLIFLMMFFACGAAQCATTMPESGIWWNSAENGRGFVIEIQDNTVFMGTFLYDQNGNATWYSAAGPMATSTRFTAKLQGYQGGQCITCPYSAPTPVGDVGDITVDFTSANTATVTWVGGVTSIQRFDFAGLSVSPNSLLGEWAIVEGSSSFPLYFGERITFNGTMQDTQGGGYFASGSRTGSPSRPALGKDYGGSVAYLILLDSSTSYYTAYQFTMTALNRIEGLSWTYLKTGTLSGSGTPFIAFRSKTKTFAMTGTGPKNAPLDRFADLTGQTDEEIGGIRARLSTAAPAKSASTKAESVAEIASVELVREVIAELEAQILQAK